MVAPAAGDCKSSALSAASLRPDIDCKQQVGGTRWASDIISDVSTLVRPEKTDDNDIGGLQARVAQLEATLRERAAEFMRVKSELEAFRTTYRQQVGFLHEELERLELAIAEAELGELAKRLDASTGIPREKPSGATSSALPRFTSDAVRKLFRDVAKVIHPDLARDEFARDRRHSLMIEANRAYASGDEEQLRWILEAWEKSPEAVQGSDPEAMRLRLVRRVAQIEEQLGMLAGDLATLTDSSVWKLKAMVDQHAAKGGDLVRDTVRRLRRDIMAATNRLDAMRPPG
jgi:hypothetical protein